MEKIGVVGGGIVGVTAAVAIKEAFPWCKVVIFGETFTPNTTGDGAAGLWTPFLCGDTPQADIVRWSEATHRWLESLWKSGLTPDTGVSLLPVIQVSSTPGFSDTVEWLHVPYASRRLSDREIRKLNEEHGTKYCEGIEYVTYTCESSMMLPWLMEKFRSLGGIIRPRKIDKLSELADEGYGIVINCTGLGARQLVGDKTVQPIRGHLTRVNAPWAYRVIYCKDDPATLIIPNMHQVVLATTAELNDYDLRVRPKDSEDIRRRCEKMVPALGTAEIVGEWVGLRPSRPRVRLEAEVLGKDDGGDYTVIHNYGHGGSGITFSWGCALDVVKMLEETVKKSQKYHSHL